MPKTHFLPGSPRSLEPFSPSTGPRPSACTKTTSPSVQRGPCTVPPAHVGIRRGRAARSTRALTSTCQRDWRLRRSEFLGPHRFQSGGGSCGPAIQFEGAALCKFARPLGRAVSCSLFPLGLRLRVPDGQGVRRVRRLPGHRQGGGPLDGPERLSTGHRRPESGGGQSRGRGPGRWVPTGVAPPLRAVGVGPRSRLVHPPPAGVRPAVLGKGRRRRAWVSRGGPRVCLPTPRACAHAQAVPPWAAGLWVGSFPGVRSVEVVLCLDDLHQGTVRLFRQVPLKSHFLLSIRNGFAVGLRISVSGW